MYERSAIVLERYFDKIFGKNKENNLKTNYGNYTRIIEKLKEYQRIIEEEEKIIRKFDEVAVEMEKIQKEQSNIHESNLEMENERNRLFNDLGENPNTLDNKLQKIEERLEENNEKLKKLREDYVKAMVIFIERQKERNKYARIRRSTETTHRNNMEYASKMFELINTKEVQEMKNFISSDKDKYNKEVAQVMIRNGKNEKVPFTSQVIEKAVNTRMKIAVQEAKLYINIYDKTKKILSELNNENIKLNRPKKLLRDVSVKLAFLNAYKEYIIGFLDNERMTAINGKKTHEKLMEEACKNFDADILQIGNLYELILRETTGKSTKKAYNQLYNKNYLKEIEENEKDFEEEVTNIKINMGTVINSNYWRIEGIKNIYKVFQEEVSEKFNKDLSEYRIEEIEDIMLPGIEEKIEMFEKENTKEIEDEDIDDEYNDEYNEEERYNDQYDEQDENYEEQYDDEYEQNYEDQYDDEYEQENNEEYEEENEEETEEYDEEEQNENELIEDDIDAIIEKSRKKSTSKNDEKMSKGFFGKFFKK